MIPACPNVDEVHCNKYERDTYKKAACVPTSSRPKILPPGLIANDQNTDENYGH